MGHAELESLKGPNGPLVPHVSDSGLVHLTSSRTPESQEGCLSMICFYSESVSQIILMFIAGPSTQLQPSNDTLETGESFSHGNTSLKGQTAWLSGGFDFIFPNS